MYVAIDSRTRRASLADPENFQQFHVAVAGAETDTALAALGSAGAPTDEDDHVWVSVAAVRGWAEGRVGEDWEQGFQKMLDYAGSAGWLDDERRHIRAHIEEGD